MKKIPETILKEVFGFDDFRPLQREIIANILNGQNTLAILPTGGGKSLCYQIPAIIFNGLTIVVSPLISLMKDQIEQLRELGIKAIVLNSSLSREEYNKNIFTLINSDVKLLYLAPETLLQPKTLNLLNSLKISLITVDEAHCISEWGHEFRPEYRRLVELKEHLSNVVWAAFTATATPRVQDDIIKSLDFESENKFIASFDRKNLFLDVVPKISAFDQTLEFIRSFHEQPGIIYCTSRKQVNELAKDLISEGIKAKPYHAGLSDSERAENQNLFTRDNIDIVVATIAFGMGINKPDIRFILHYDLPKNIESYYQQIGRAGRDGLQSYCRLLFSYGDISKIRYFINLMTVDSEWEIAEKHLSAMVKFAENGVCRRIPLISYFGEAYSETNCGMCDNCTGSIEDQTDVTIQAQKFLSCIARSGEYFGINHIIGILRGSKAEKIIKLKHDELSTYSIGNEFDKNQWILINNELLKQGYINRDKNGGLRLNPRAWKVFRNEIKIYCSGIEKNTSEIKRFSKDSDYDNVLFEKLRLIRKELADQRNIPPFVIFSNKALMDICRKFPVTFNSFKKIHGVGNVKAETYAPYFIPVIKDYCEKNEININLFSEKNKLSGKKVNNRKIPQSFKIAETFNETVNLELTAEHFNIKESTVLDHLYKFVNSGNNLIGSKHLLNYVNCDNEIIKTVFFLFEELGCNYLKPILEELDSELTYNDLKILRIIYLS